MATPHEVSTKISEVLDIAQRAAEVDLSQGYESLNAGMKKLEAIAREAFQAKLKLKYRTILRKLENGRSLSQEELKVVKFLIVGEAKYYLHHENDLENWKNEVQRLLSEIEKLQNGDLDNVNTLMHLRALCHDAMRVVPDLAFYYHQYERVKRFEGATNGSIDREAGMILANVIREMMLSGRS